MEDKIVDLWRWFVSSENHIIKAIETGVGADDVVEKMNELVLSFGMFTWHIEKGESKKWAFTISPNGDGELLKISREVVLEAPILSKWEFYHGKQPKTNWDRKFVIHDSELDEQEIDASAWNYVLVPIENQFELILEATNIGHIDDDAVIEVVDQFITYELGEEVKINKIESIEVKEEFDGEFKQNRKPVNSLKSTLA
ncbi:MAG: hypothetical protein ACI9J3_003580 [Parvicellaceae bacterium]|jgi:hypothetical protein